jgi:hypothetical protein
MEAAAQGMGQSIYIKRQNIYRNIPFIPCTSIYERVSSMSNKTNINKKL